jgi:cob(I)alamin adenosyltransferase
MKIYTKGGDQGETSLFSGTRVPKHHLRIDSYGSLDELNAFLGLLRDQQAAKIHQEFLIFIQDRLFSIGSHLATESDKQKAVQKLPEIKDEDVDRLEDEIDRLNEDLPPMTNFILPGGHTTVSYCHIARCVCRRAERLVTALHEKADFNDIILKFINRLSDYLFVLSRKLSKDLECEEIKWIPSEPK